MTAKKSDSKIEVPRSASITPVEVQSKVDVANIQAIETIGLDIIRKTGEVAGAYLSLCLYIRQHEMAPKLVSLTLTKLGLKRSRVSEINKVAQSSEKLFKEYEARRIGFDKALDMSRVEVGGKAPVQTPAAQALLAAGSLDSDDVEGLVGDENAPGEAGHAETSVGQKIKNHAKAICKLATRNAVYTFNDFAYRVRVEKIADVAPPGGESDRN